MNKRKSSIVIPEEHRLVFKNSFELATLTSEEVAVYLKANTINGLKNEQVEHRRKFYGKNIITPPPQDPLWRKFLDNIREPILVLLLAAALITFAMGSHMDAASILFAVLLVCTIGNIQEYCSEKKLIALKKLMPQSCTVFREGQFSTIDPADLVPGDIISLTTGDRVPADIRLFETIQLSIDESGFTGETKAMYKKADVVPDGDKLTTSDYPKLKNIAFMGTLVLSGNGLGIVSNCGDKTEFGEIFRMLQAEEPPMSPLRRAMRVLGIQLTIMALIIIVIIFFVGIIQSRPLLTLFVVAVSLAVAAIPEGLPIVTTVTLAVGVGRMATRNAIVKKLPTVETLGCVNVICSDKTGTLTKNEMTVTVIATSDGTFADVTGVGYDTSGEIFLRDEKDTERSSKVTAYSADASAKHGSAGKTIYRLLEVAVLCNNAKFVDDNIVGKPTEGALVIAAVKFKMDSIVDKYQRLEEIAFSSETKIMSVTCFKNDDPDKKPIIFMKGATDIIIRKCAFYYDGDTELEMTEDKINEYIKLNVQLGSQGLRVLSFARGPDKDKMSYCGLVGITDPPRPMVPHAIRLLTESSVRVIMITGDAEETATAIAKQIGLDVREGRVMAGYKLDNMDDVKSEKCVREVNVFFRVTPRHKLIIVKALQRSNFIVAMTGDGVNDSIALKRADIGIAMGINGTDVCKEAADMILVDDNFLTIISAIEEGKSIFYNIRNFVRFQMTVSFAALSLIAFSFFMNVPTPLSATQILIINIVMDGPPAQSLSLEPVDQDVLKEKPRDSRKPMVNRSFIINCLIDAYVIVALCTCISAFERNKYDGGTALTFTAFVTCSFFQCIACRSYHKSLFEIGLFTNRVLIIVLCCCSLFQMSLIYTPGMQMVFKTHNLDLVDLTLCLLAGITIIMVSELKKLIFRALTKKLKLADSTMRRPPFPSFDSRGERESVESLASLRSASSSSYYAV